VAISDFQINSRVRAILARSWIDLQKITFGSFRGTVRFSGELCLLGGRTNGCSKKNQVESLEYEVRAIRGVQRIFFDLSNWQRNDTGDWCSTGTSQGKTAVRHEGSSGPALEMTLKDKSTHAQTKAVKDESDEHLGLP
jgi:hypothetical protein